MKRLSKKPQFSPTGLIATSVFALALGCTIGCSESGPAKTVATVANQQSVTFFVDGMVWGTSWTEAVEKQLKELPGVVEVSTDMDTQTATVGYDPEKFQPEDAMDSFTGRFQLSIHEGDPESP